MTRRAHLWVRYALPVIAFWPVWRWLFARTTDGTQEGFGLVSWALAFVFVVSRARTRNNQLEPSLGLATVLTLGYALTYAHVPPIVRAFFAVSALLALVSRQLEASVRAPLWGLMLLGLPIEASLQFYVGYPLRVVATQVAAQLLHGLGFAVLPQGTELVWGALEISVDAPCSGIGMLRMALVSCCALSLLHNARLTVWASTVASTFVLAVLANALRSASLFLLEGGFLGSVGGLADSLHAGAGLVLFVAVLAAQAWLIGLRVLAGQPAVMEAT